MCCIEKVTLYGWSMVCPIEKATVWVVHRVPHREGYSVWVVHGVLQSRMLLNPKLSVYNCNGVCDI